MLPQPIIICLLLVLVTILKVRGSFFTSQTREIFFIRRTQGQPFSVWYKLAMLSMITFSRYEQGLIFKATLLEATHSLYFLTKATPTAIT